MDLKCLHCDHEFEGTISWDDLGWHSSCPRCGCSFDVDFCFCLTAYCPRKDCSRHKSRVTGDVMSADLCTPNWKNCRNFQKG